MKRLNIILVAVVAVLVALAPSAVAAPSGHLDTGICSLPGAGVTVTATTIDWTPPTGGGNGCIVTGSATLVNYTGGGPLINAVTGTILDLNIVTTVLPLANFMTFSGNPNLHFDLTSLGPGPTRTDCAALALFESCAVFTGSPFILTRTTTGTAVTLSATGIARDSSAATSIWSGAFTTQLSGRAPGVVQANINAGGSETSTHSGDFNLTLNQVPEPGTVSMVLLGSGLIAMAVRRRRTQV